MENSPAVIVDTAFDLWERAILATETGWTIHGYSGVAGASKVSRGNARSFLKRLWELGEAPPVAIHFEPCGGLIIDFQESDGFSRGWTFYDSGLIEMDIWHEGRLIETKRWRGRPFLEGLKKMTKVRAGK